MTTDADKKALEDLKAKARALRNKKSSNTAFVSTDPYAVSRSGAGKQSQTTHKAARKPSV